MLWLLWGWPGAQWGEFDGVLVLVFRAGANVEATEERLHGGQSWKNARLVFVVTILPRYLLLPHPLAATLPTSASGQIHA